MSNTLGWLQADVHRAEHEGASSLSVNLKDLKEVLNELQSLRHKAQAGFVGKSIGYVNGEHARLLLSGESRTIKIRRKLGGYFDSEVFFVDLAPKKMVDVVAECDSLPLQ